MGQPRVASTILGFWCCVAGAAGMKVLDAAGITEGRAGMIAREVQDLLDPGRNLFSLMPKPFNCTENPFMCEAPYNCHTKLNAAERTKKLKTMATDGHPNLHTWCNAPQYIPSLVRTCLRDHNLKLSAQKVYTATVKKRFGPFTAELDASYCFMEGHCTNTAVTYDTTLEDAEKMCDYRFGHKGWAVNFGYNDMVGIAFSKPGGMTVNNGFTNPRLTKLFLKAACAMGNYHCDVIYCKDTYCSMPNYTEKYQHLLPKTPGHEIRQLD
mmetsp:Transcript_33485/g.77821  ORF Transcript_33485/g.77821 Transcript_33485/m.77821 type:complete len:267 (+) Transcript_33485:50-850(+)